MENAVRTYKHNVINNGETESFISFQFFHERSGIESVDEARMVFERLVREGFFTKTCIKMNTSPLYYFDMKKVKGVNW
ncbi:MAG TPA: hypothetical protein VFX18_03245 [Candidatus Nitrosocosmicus sp.]|nr:hypothetical protein [Candidatus Nitrosocosmicus sp.]